MKLTARLKALLLGGTVAISAAQAASATQVPPAKTSSVETRIDTIRQQAQNNQAGTVVQGNGPKEHAGLMWWRNAWGNGGGWRNGGWHNGWGNWHNY